MEARYDVILTNGSSEGKWYNHTLKRAMQLAEVLLNKHPDCTVAVRRQDFDKEKDTGTEA